ncbi:hypothetical protein [Nonomuraea sp. NPDC050783]|uniref:hypothetical protein n=1 Tax=Nonomuraea sp. NPDC050783 TaxID=3154634 RepID=UPI00346648F9
MKKSIFENKLVADMLYITTEYAKFYDSAGGARKADYAQKLTEHYADMSTFDTRYLNTPTPPTAMVKYLQGMKDGKYKFSPQEGTLKDALTKPDAMDYFHFQNYDHARGQAPEASRRIVVGLWSQSDALPLADAMLELFKDPDIGPRMASFKVFLSFNPSTTRTDPVQMKGDKAVIYYSADLDDLDTDRVGSTIARAVDAAVPANRRDARLAPFYEEIAQGIAWADETGKASFTQVRDDLITRVVRANPNVTDQRAFYDLVLAQMRQDNVDPSATHRYFADVETPPAPKLG